MGKPLTKLEEELLELPHRRRAELAHLLLVSLDDEEEAATIEQEWDEEICRRLAEIEAGTAEMIPAEAVIAEARARRGR